MINVTSAFKNEVFVNDNRNYQYEIRITFADSTYIDLTNDNLMSNGGVIIDEAVSSENKLSVGACIVNKLTLTLQNFSGEYDSYDFLKANVVLKIGLAINGVTEKFQRGIYIVSEPPMYNTSCVTLVCYDYMTLLDIPYSSVSTVYPASISTIINDICTACGVLRETQALPNDSLVISENPATSITTCREMLSYVAQINCRNCRFTPLGKLEFVWFSDGFTGTTLTVRQTQDGAVRSVENNVVRISYRQNAGEVSWLNQVEIPGVYTLDMAKQDTVVTGVRIVIPMTEDPELGTIDTYETGTDDYLISVEENPLINASNADAILATLATLLLGFKYRKATVSHLGMPWMVAGDSAVVADYVGVRRNIVVTSTVFTALDRQSTESSGADPVVATASRYSPETTQLVKTMENIKPVIQNLNQRIANANGLYETRQTSQGATITYLHNKPDLAESDIQIMISDVGVLVTSNGTDPTPTWYGLTVDGNLIANILQTNGINADWIDTGALVIYDNDNNEIFRADKSGKIFRWNAENSQMDADGTITLKSFYDDQQGSGSASDPAFTSTKDIVTHYSVGTYAVGLKRVIIQYGEKIIMNTTWYDFSTEADYELFAEDGDESHAANITARIVTYSNAYIQVKDGSNNYFLDFNFGAGVGSIELNGRLIEPFWAYYNEITSGSNMNSYTTPGTYKCYSSSVTNAPFSEPFQCCVYESGAAPGGVTGSIMQIAWNFSSSTMIKYRMYVTNTGWSAWYGIQKEGVAYKTGTVTIASGTQSTATQTISITDIVPSGKTPYGVVLTLGGYPMPYVNSSGNVVTWISGLSNSAVTISNKTSAWSNYNYYLTIFYH